MTMASGSYSPTPDDMMQNFKAMFDFLKPIFEPPQKVTSKPDLSASISSSKGQKFMETMRTLSEKMYQMPAMDPLQVSTTAATKLSPGDIISKSPGLQKKKGEGKGPMQIPADRQDQIKNLEKEIDALRKENNELKQKVAASAGHAFSQSQGSEKKERSQDSFKTPSQASGSPQPTTDVNEGSVNQQDGGASKTKHDTDIEKLKKEIKELEGQNARLAEEKHDFKNTVDQDQNTIKNLEQQIKNFKQELYNFEKRCNEGEILIQDKNKTLEVLLDTRNKHLQDISALDNAVKKYQQDIEDRDRTIMSLGNDLQSLSTEHNDLKSRFSKLAGHKLTDQNPDIADLSDPNRAMKLSEKFGALYDDAWTDAFEHLTDEKQKLKLKPKEAIEFLLDCLKECWGMCQKEAEAWMNSLQNNFLHPVQDIEAMSKMPGGKSALRLGSKDLRVIRDACRKIAPTVGVLVKQCFIMKIKKNQKNQKFIDDCMTYLEGCVDVCWLMVLAEPPLHIDFNIKPGDKFDSNRHAAYSSTGEKVEFLVWPPLYNAEEKGGMLSKGTVSTERKIEKPSKK